MREKHQLVASCATTRDLTHNPGVCPDWELNWQHFGLQDDSQTTEPHQSGHKRKLTSDFQKVHQRGFA